MRALFEIFPHHAFNRPGGPLVILCVLLAVIVIFNFTLHCEVNELSDGHAGIDANGLDARDFEGPGIGEAYIAFSSRGVYVNTESANTTFAF